MPDSFPVTPGSGSNVATRSVNNIHYQKVMGDLKQYEVSSGWGRGATGNRLPAAPAVAKMMLAPKIHLEDAFLEGGSSAKPEVAEIISFDIFSGHDMVRGSSIDSTPSPTSYRVHTRSGLIGIVYTAADGSFANGTNIHKDDAMGTGVACAMAAVDAGKILAVLNFQKTVLITDGGTSPIGVFQYKMINQFNQFRALVATTTADRDLYVRLMVGTTADSYIGQPDADAPFTAKIVVDRIVF